MVVAPSSHDDPIDGGPNSLSVNTKLARARYMSLEELWPAIGWK